MNQNDQSQKLALTAPHGSHHLLLVSQLFKAISHKIRTPLSVISNELACIDTNLADISRSQRRCREIVDILDGIPSAALAAPTFESVKFSELDLPCSIDPSVRISADRKLLPLAFQMFEALCAELFKAKPSFGSMVQSGREIGNSILLRVAINHQPFGPEQRRYESVTDYFCQSLSIDTPLAPFIDSIFWAHHAKIDIIVSSSSTFSFTIPIAA